MHVRLTQHRPPLPPSQGGMEPHPQGEKGNTPPQKEEGEYTTHPRRERNATNADDSRVHNETFFHFKDHVYCQK